MTIGCTGRKTGGAATDPQAPSGASATGFNSGLVDEVAAFMSRTPDRRARFITVGKVIHRRIRRIGLDVLDHFVQPARRTRAATLDRIADLAVRTFLSGGCSEVHVVSTKFVSALRQAGGGWRVVPAPFLPVEVIAKLSLVPDAAEMLHRLLPEFVRQMH